MQPESLFRRKFQGEFALWAIFVHVGAAALLPWYFSWGNLALGFGLAALTAYSMGIFHHMYLSHGSFRAHPALANLGVLLGTLTWRGPMAAPVRYVAMHRIHHRFSDRELDPHSPVHGIFHSLLGWNWNFAQVFAEAPEYSRFASKTAANPWFAWLDRHVHLAQGIYASVLFLLGGFVGALSHEAFFDFHQATAWMVYGVFAKTLFVIYLANLVDVINHTVGYRSYETKDQSTNSFWMALVHLGGAVSWHNNHHARPNYFSVKRHWWEFDMHHQFLRALSLLGLVWDIKVLDESASGSKKEPKILDFLTQSPLRASAMILGRFAQLAVPLTLLTWMDHAQWSLTAKIASALVLAPLAAIGFHNLALLGHEGTHFNLARNKLRSSLLGTFFSSIVPFHFNTGFAISHSAHHLFTNSEKDPDVALFSPFHGWRERLASARRAATISYAKLTLRAAFSSHSGLKIAGLTERELKKLARLNLAFAAGFLVVEIALLFWLGGAFALVFFLGYGGAYLLSSIRPYLEHAGTDGGPLTRARTFSSRGLDFAFGTINYHLAHHLHPRVPAYHLPALHRWLEQNALRDLSDLPDSKIIRSHRWPELRDIIGQEPYGALTKEKKLAQNQNILRRCKLKRTGISKARRNASLPSQGSPKILLP